MIVLGVDTALNACSVAVVDGDRVLASTTETMVRGQQERLSPMVRDLLQEAGVRPAQVGRVAVTVGPGSFTGLRIGLAFAKGFAFAREVPCVGVGTLEALAGSASGAGLTAAVIDANQGQVYLQLFESGRSLMAPDRLSVELASARLAELYAGGQAVLVGSGAHLLKEVLRGAEISTLHTPDPAVVARIGAAVREPPPPARPLYLRAPYANMEPV